MAGFRRKPKPPSLNDPSLPDHTWLEGGEARFEQLRPGYGDDPDALLQATRARLAVDDPASALFFVARAVAQLASAHRAPDATRRPPSDADRLLLGSCWSTFRSVQRQRPAAPIAALAAATADHLYAIEAALQVAGVAAETREPYANVAGDLLEISRQVAEPPPPPAADDDEEPLALLRQLAEEAGEAGPPGPG